MKKILGALVCAVIFATVSVQAQAALLTDWNYDLSDIKLSNVNTDYATVNTKGQVNVTVGNYNTTLTIGSDVNGSLSFTGKDSSADNEGSTDTLLNQTTTVTDSPLINTGATKLADLAFTYTMTSDANPLQKLDITYTIPLYTYYDMATETAYIYYDALEVSLKGTTLLDYDGYKYGITGVVQFVDGTPLDWVQVPGSDNALNMGWSFDDADTLITSSISIFNIYKGSEDPAPTPEPATMLLMGAGLAGLGYVKRRRSN